MAVKRSDETLVASVPIQAGLETVRKVASDYYSGSSIHLEPEGDEYRIHTGKGSTNLMVYVYKGRYRMVHRPMDDNPTRVDLPDMTIEDAIQHIREIKEEAGIDPDAKFYSLDGVDEETVAIHDELVRRVMFALKAMDALRHDR